MTLVNSIYASTPFSTTVGGTQNTSSLNTGQLWIGTSLGIPAINTLTAGTDIDIDNGGTGTITINSTLPDPLTVARGGTGNSTALTDGQLWVGSTGGNPVPVNLTAGTNVSIVNGPGSITINASVPSLPLSVANGGTGNSTQLTNGQIWVGNTGNVPSISTITAGTNVTVTNGAGTVTIASSTPLSTVLPNPTITVINLARNTSYLTTNTSGGITNFMLPASPTVGEFYEIIGGGSQGWKVAQNASQVMQIGTVQTSTGTPGSIQSNNSNDSVRIYCQNTSLFVVIILCGQITYN